MDTLVQEAEAAALRFATQCGLPQTVFRNADSGGWWHTNPFATFLSAAELHVTVLPSNYFN